VTFLHPEGDTGPKLRSYAAAGVPVYILINRETKTAHCYTAPVFPGDDPKKAYYDARLTYPPAGNPLSRMSEKTSAPSPGSPNIRYASAKSAYSTPSRSAQY
jgi:hypothetical protein